MGAIRSGTFGEHQERVVARGLLDKGLALNNLVDDLLALFFGAAARDEDGINELGQLAHDRHLLEPNINSKGHVEELIKVHGVDPADVVNDQS